MCIRDRIHDATATAVTPCKALKLSRKEMVLLLHEQHEFSDIFLKFVLLRGVRTREDLIDQLFNNSEKRLARTLQMCIRDRFQVIGHLNKRAS